MKSLARNGLDLLLAYYPDADLVRISTGSPLASTDSSWWDINLTNGSFAIWVRTGCVYRMPDGAVHDDPFLVPAESPYRIDGAGRQSPAAIRRFEELEQ